MPGRIQLANDIEANWLLETIPLAVGELGWATDTRQLKVGDGNSLWADLAILVSGASTGAAQIDDSSTTGSSTTTYSSQKILSVLSDNSNGDRKYTDDSVRGLTAPYVVVDQGSDGTWPNRPTATNVLARTYFGNTTVPTWLTAADEVEYRSA